MTCRHSDDDPTCGSYAANVAHAKHLVEQDRVLRGDPQTPDASNYEVVDVMRCGKHLVMKVKYPNCTNCAYEGQKVMVFLNVTEIEALRWRKIDPHFRKEHQPGPYFTEAPSPAARFPGSVEGWNDACDYARKKDRE